MSDARRDVQASADAVIIGLSQSVSEDDEGMKSHAGSAASASQAAALRRKKPCCLCKQCHLLSCSDSVCDFVAQYD